MLRLLKYTKYIFMRKLIQWSSAAIIVLAVAMGINSCRKVENGPVNTPTNQFQNTARVIADVSGQVFDESGKPITGAVVTIENNSYTTGKSGVFQFKNINTLEKATLIKVSKPGNFNAFRTLSIMKGKDNYTVIRMMSKGTADYMTSSANATISVKGGGSVKFPANGFKVEANGAPYTGVVKVYSKRIAADDAKISELIPGALRGLTTVGEENDLTTYGMLAVELEDNAGNKLNLAAGSEAEATFPIAATQLAVAPSEIQLWSFDEKTGMWTEEGKAVRDGNNYVAKLKHFSYWNCDYGGPIVNFTATFIDSNTSLPLNNLTVAISSSAAGFGGGTRSAYTGANGSVSGGLPTNTSFTLNVMDPNCGTTIYSTTFSSLTSAINLGTIAIMPNPANTATINFTVVDCSGNPIPNAYCYLNPSTTGSFYNTIAQANASGVVTQIKTLCVPSVNYDITAFDPVNNVNGSLTASIIAGANNLGNVAACGTLNPFFIWTVADGTNSYGGNSQAPLDYIGGSYSAPLTYITTSVQGSPGGGTTNGNSCNISFDGSGTAGSHLLQSISAYAFSAGTTNYVSSDSNVNINVPINITQYAPATNGFVEGNYNSTFSNPSNPGTTYTITGSFRVKRTW
jgi:hypothetical protein